jgi:hypothetical protein
MQSLRNLAAARCCWEDPLLPEILADQLYIEAREAHERKFGYCLREMLHDCIYGPGFTIKQRMGVLDRWTYRTLCQRLQTSVPDLR